jgi:FkbM family methyltransferase
MNQSRVYEDLKHVIKKGALQFLSSIPANSTLQGWAWRDAVRRHRMETGSGYQQTAFFYFALTNRAFSKAQLFQDLWVVWQTRFKRKGFFVDFGATDGVKLSNTWLLEKEFGWEGILAEPFPYWHPTLAANRSAIIDHRCVWKDSNQQLSFLALDEDPEVAGLEVAAFDDFQRQRREKAARKIDVATVSLFDLLHQHCAPPRIDYLSIDTEGTELEILEGFDFSSYLISLVSVEHNYELRKREGIRRLLEKNGFRRTFEHLSLWDDWYVNESAPASAPDARKTMEENR